MVSSYFLGFLLCINTVQALQCYNCTYWKDRAGSTNDCKKQDPGSKYLIDCRTSAMLDLYDLGYLDHRKSTDQGVYCVKTAGILFGKDFIYRTCAVDNWEGDRTNKCLFSNENDTIINIPGKGNVSGEICYCNTKKCNIATHLNDVNNYFLIWSFLVTFVISYLI